MNDKDKEAFDKWFKTLDNPSYKLMLHLDEIYKEAWQAACEYKDTENKKLREALEFYAKCDGFCADDECVCSTKIAIEALKEIGK